MQVRRRDSDSASRPYVTLSLSHSFISAREEDKAALIATLFATEMIRHSEDAQLQLDAFIVLAHLASQCTSLLCLAACYCPFLLTSPPNLHHFFAQPLAFVSVLAHLLLLL